MAVVEPNSAFVYKLGANEHHLSYVCIIMTTANAFIQSYIALCWLFTQKVALIEMDAYYTFVLNLYQCIQNLVHHALAKTLQI